MFIKRVMNDCSDHVECPERIMRIHERHRDYGLLERVRHLTSRAATDEEILLLHEEEHLNRYTYDLL